MAKNLLFKLLRRAFNFFFHSDNLVIENKDIIDFTTFNNIKDKTTLFVSKCNISSLKGLDRFRNINFLTISTENIDFNEKLEDNAICNLPNLNIIHLYIGYEEIILRDLPNLRILRLIQDGTKIYLFPSACGKIEEMVLFISFKLPRMKKLRKLKILYYDEDLSINLLNINLYRLSYFSVEDIPEEENEKAKFLNYLNRLSIGARNDILLKNKITVIWNSFFYKKLEKNCLNRFSFLAQY